LRDSHVSDVLATKIGDHPQKSANKTLLPMPAARQSLARSERVGAAVMAELGVRQINFPFFAKLSEIDGVLQMLECAESEDFFAADFPALGAGFPRLFHYFAEFHASRLGDLIGHELRVLKRDRLKNAQSEQGVAGATASWGSFGGGFL
jgi:hypothetical protein